MDKLKELSNGEKVIGVSAVVLLINSFLPWYSVDLGVFGDYSRNGWQAPSAFLSMLAVLIGIAMGALVVVRALGAVELPEKLGGIGWGMAYLIGGGVAFLLVVIKWLGNTDYTAFGLYLGLLCTAGLAVGGFLTAKERGELPSSAPTS